MAAGYRASLILMTVLMGGCGSFGAFSCDSDEDCVTGRVVGRCELETNACSFPDLACASGHRYAELSVDGIAGVCVDASSGYSGTGDDALPFDDGTSGASTTSSSVATSAGMTSLGASGDMGVDDGALSSTDGSTTNGDATSGGMTSADGGDAADDGSSSTGEPASPVTLRFGECSSCDVGNVTTDTYLRQNQSGNNFGGHLDVHFGSGSTGLLRFDLSSIPSGATILDADLQLDFDLGTATSASVSLHRMLESWREGGGAAGKEDGDPGTANWYDREPGVSWTASGAGEGSRESSSLASLNLANGGRVMVDLPVNVVQAWVDTPSQNYGLAITGNLDGSYIGWFQASEYHDSSDRPKLVITYVP